MSCAICSAPFGSSRRPTCPACAIATLYESRFVYAKQLLDKEHTRSQVDIVLQPPSELAHLPPDSNTVELTESARRLAADEQRALTAKIEARVAGIQEQQARLRLTIERARADIATRRVTHTELRTSLRNDRMNFEVQKRILTEPIRTESARLESKLLKIRKSTIDGRSKLCRETARLFGLVTRKRRMRDGQVRDEVLIGGLVVPDLRDIHTTRPDQLRASLANVCRLVAGVCHYLSVRLPAEIIHPHPDHPHPTILSLQSSYQGADPALGPGSRQGSGLISRSSAHSLSRVQAGRSAQPKSRPLSVVHTVPRLAKDDPSAYNLFIEGITLLAWDIAWLCRSQGILDIDSWQDTCAMGRNLYRLLVADNTTATTLRTVRFGEYSHGTMHLNLAGPSGVEVVIKTWSLPPLANVSDKIKSFLLTEMSGAEWELLDEKEWCEEREDERAVLVGGSRMVDEDGKAPGTDSQMGVRGEGTGDRISTSTMAATTRGDKSGGKGWTKLKSRPNETRTN